MAVTGACVEGALAHEHQQQFHTNGFVKVPALFSPDESP